jgi:mRNA interferase RelE/StbE
VTYTIHVAPAFRHDLKKLDRQIQKRIIDALEALSEEPRPRGVEKLKENPKFYRIAVGDYRIVYNVDGKKHIVVACLVRHRKDAYRDIANLNISAIMETLKPLLVKSSTAS